MKKLLGIMVLLSLSLVLFACDDNTRTMSIDVEFSETVTAVTFASDESLEVQWLSDTLARLEGLTVGQSIEVKHSVVSFSPAVFSVTENDDVISITVISDHDDDRDNDDDDVIEARSQTVVVASFDALESAVALETTGKVVYAGDLAGDLVISGLINLDLSGFTHTGNISVVTSEAGSVLYEDGMIDGTFTVDAVNASVENHLEVSGTIVVKAVASHSFYEEADGNTVKVEASDVLISVNGRAAQLMIDASDVRVVVTNTMPLAEVFKGHTGVSFVGAAYIDEIVLMSASVFLDALPSTLSGDFLPDFDKAIIAGVKSELVFAVNHGSEASFIEAMIPDTLEVETIDGDKVMVDVIGFEPLDLVDEETIETQSIRYRLEVMWGDELINALYLVPTVEVNILSVRDSFTAVEFIYTEDDETFEYGDAESLEALKALLPAKLYVSLGGWSYQLLDAEWTVVSGAFDPLSEAEQVLVFSGMVTESPIGYHILDIEPIEITVTILERDPNDWVVEPSGDVHIQTNYPEAIGWTIEENVMGHVTEVLVTFIIDDDYTIDSIEYYHTGFVFEPDLPTHRFTRSTEGGQLHIIVHAIQLERPDVSVAFSGGDGTESDPFVITDHEELQNMQYYLDGDRHFVLGNNITIPSDFDFQPMTSPKSYRPFSGVFDGQHFTIDGYRVEVTEEDAIQVTSFIEMNAGVIRNVKFTNVSIINPENIQRDGVLVRRNLQGSLIEHVTVQGYREGQGAGVVGSNEGLIQHLIVDLSVLNGNAGIAYTNHGVIKNSTVNISMLITKQNIGQIAGVVGDNTTYGYTFGTISSGLIENVHATVDIDVDIDSVRGDDGLSIGGFAYRNRGVSTHSDQVAARILQSSVDVTIRMLGEYRVGNIGGFVSMNTDGGYIYNSSATGSLEGRFNIGGFTAQNVGGILPSELDSVTAHVNVFATGNTNGGLVAINQGTSFSIAAIVRDSEAFGDVVGTSSTRALIGSGNGRVIDSVGHGSVTYYTE